MKIAYLITAYNNYEHLNRLLLSLDDENVHFYIHIDMKSPMPSTVSCEEKVTFIDRIKVFWGGWSHQAAINSLIEAAYSSKADYYILISGSDYPIRPKSFLYKKLASGKEFINIMSGFHASKPEWRIKYFHFDWIDRKRKNPKTLFFYALELMQRKLKIIAKRKYPFTRVYFGSTWWALSHGCLEYVIKFIHDNPKFTNFYKTSFCPEESYIHTIIGNSPYLDKCIGNLTYADWTENKSGPAIIGKQHLSIFKMQSEFESMYGKYTPFFARKFNDLSKDVVKAIDNELIT